MLSAARLCRASRSPIGSHDAFSRRRMLHCLCRAGSPMSLQPAVARSGMLVVDSMPILGPELRFAQQPPAAIRLWVRYAGNKSSWHRSRTKDGFSESRPKGAGKFTGTPLRVRQAAARANRNEEQPAEDDDLVVLYSADDTMRRTYKFTGLVIIALQLYIVIVAYGYLLQATVMESKDKAQATPEEGRAGTLQSLQQSPRVMRLVAVVNTAVLVVSYVVASRSSQNTLLSMVLRRADRYVHIRTFPELADYPRRNCFSKSWMRDMPATRLSVQPHRRSGRCKLVITYEDDQKRKLVMHNRFIIKPDIWKELKLDIPKEK